VIVVDASVVVAALVGLGPAAAWAEDVLTGAVAAPHLLHVEVVHTLRREVRRGRLSPDAAGIALDDLDRLHVTLFGFAAVMERVWELRDVVTPYDAWYVALAEELEAPLATLDRRLMAAPGTRCRFETAADR
jgi:predicted nucleic acid-binding protein